MPPHKKFGGSYKAFTNIMGENIGLFDCWIVKTAFKQQSNNRTIPQSLCSYFFNPEFDNTRWGLYFCNIAHLFTHNTFSYRGTYGNFTKL